MSSPDGTNLVDGKGTLVMVYVIEVSKQDVSYRAEDGTWLDGDRRVLRDHGTERETWEAGGPGPVSWAVAWLQGTDAQEPSVYPIPAELPEHAWLSGTYEHPCDGTTLESSYRLTGDWTPQERAEVFRVVAVA